MGGRRNPYRYSEYRGRNGGRVRTVLLFIIALLAVLLAAGVAFMAFMGPYIEYTDNGIIIHWPWTLEDGAPSHPPIASDPLEMDSDPIDVTVEPTLEVEPTADPGSSYIPIGAVEVTEAQVRGGTAVQAVLSAGGGALMVEMKDYYGRLSWQSRAPLAASLGANAGDDLTRQAVRALADSGELYLVAKVTCFRDPLLARNRVGPIMTRGGNVWFDVLGLSWTSPANQQAADYISALCLELADMGFDEVLLDCAGYPNAGEVNVLATSDNRPEDLTVPVSGFLGRVSGELAEKGVCLSVLTDESLLPGEAVLSGLTAEVLAQNVGRVWLAPGVSREQYSAILTTAGLENTSARIVSQNNAVGSWYR